jgi:hypothetical protein
MSNVMCHICREVWSAVLEQVKYQPLSQMIILPSQYLYNVLHTYNMGKIYFPDSPSIIPSQVMYAPPKLNYLLFFPYVYIYSFF